MTIPEPALHRPMSMIEVFEPTSQDELCNQLGGSLTPKVRSSELTSPTSGLRTQIHSSEAATMGTMAGR